MADSPENTAFRKAAAEWLRKQLSGPFKQVRNRGGSGQEDESFDERRAWEKAMGAAGWTCVGWPTEHGGRGATLAQQVIFAEEYARAGGPGRVGHIGEGLIGPTLIAFGTEAQKKKFLPAIRAGNELWCQGYSEPAAGSDLANVQCKARFENGEWILDGQKVWTSLAHRSDWIFVLCRTEPDAPRYKNLSFLLVPMRQPGIEVRPIVQLTGTSEFNQVFFTGARTPAENIVGARGEGWKIALALLGFERGASTLAQQLAFENEFAEVIALAKANGIGKDPVIRQRLADAWIGLKLVKLNTLRALGEDPPKPGRAAINKLFWSTWHQKFSELAMDVAGPEAEICAGAPYTLSPLQNRFLFSRAETIYAGSSEIQRNIIAEQALGLPKDPRPDRS